MNRGLAINSVRLFEVTNVDEQKEAGYFTITWDGRDSNGNPVASGIYLYQIKAGGTSPDKSGGRFCGDKKNAPPPLKGQGQQGQ